MARWKSGVNVARLLIGLVLFVNLQCAVLFLVFPEHYVAGFELIGVPGVGMVQGMGILFLMWNVPYVVALADPVRQSMSLLEATIMQVIGLTGESILLFTFPDGHSAIMSTVTRFVLFDGAGLVALLLAGFLVRKQMPGIIVSGCGT